MTLKTLMTAVALASATALAVAATSARADDCDDIMDAVKKLTERTVNAKDDAKTPLAVCWAVGQLVGMTKAGREVAAECYDEGTKRTDLLASLDKTTKEMEAQFDSICK
jgi:hypothetical protein